MSDTATQQYPLCHNFLLLVFWHPTSKRCLLKENGCTREREEVKSWAWSLSRQLICTPSALGKLVLRYVNVNDTRLQRAEKTVSGQMQMFVLPPSSRERDSKQAARAVTSWWWDIDSTSAALFAIVFAWLMAKSVTLQRTQPNRTCCLTTTGWRAERWKKNWRSIIACCHFSLCAWVWGWLWLLAWGQFFRSIINQNPSGSLLW